jgi:DNA-binding beta-propeller fold protein YncE
VTPARALALTVHALVALGLAACASSAGSTAAPSPTTGASPVLPTMTPEATIAVPEPGWFTSDGTVLWLLTATGKIGRLDPTTNSLGTLAVVDATHKDGGFAASPRGVWLADFDTDLLYRMDPASLKVVARIRVGTNPEGVAVDPRSGAVWVANHRGGSVDRVDPATDRVVASVKVGSTGPSGPHQVTVGLGSVWVGVPNASRYYRIDPRTNTVAAMIDVPLGGAPCGGFAFSKVAVWTPSCRETTNLVRIDPVANKAVAVVELGGYGSDPVLVQGFPWLVVESLSDGPGRLVRVSPTTNKVDRVFSFGDGFKGGGLTVLDGSVWLTDWANSTIMRLPLAAFAP